MRRAAGSHVRTARTKLGIVSQTTVDGKQLAPSLRAEYVKAILEEKARLSKEAEIALVVDRPNLHRRLARRRRSLSKGESPRSGLRPADTHGLPKSKSKFIPEETRLREFRKYSDFGVIAPVPLDLPMRKSKSFNTVNSLKKKGGGGEKRLVHTSSLYSRVWERVTTLRRSLFRSSNPKVEVTTENSENAPACSKTGFVDSNHSDSHRRSSLFAKRPSLSMETIKKVELDSIYSVYKQLGTGRFGYVKLAEHKESSQKIAIKFFPKPPPGTKQSGSTQADFVREYNYSKFLSPHQHVIDTFEGMFQATDEAAYFFVQEFCPNASLREAVEATNQAGIGEINTKKVMLSVLSAIEFMHDENLVHRNLKAENILLFDKNDYSRVKVTDFGLTRKTETTVKYLEYVNNYQAPELCETVVNEVLTVHRSCDVWALGVIVFYCMRGRFPWQKASIMCKPYWEWEQWLKRKNPSLPKKFLPFSEKAVKMFKKSLNPRWKDRWTAKDLRKCLNKEKLIKVIKKPEEIYAPVSSRNRDRDRDRSPPSDREDKKRSAIQQWISSSLTIMAEISEQVVSARDD